MDAQIRRVAITNTSPNCEDYAGECTSHKREVEVEKGTSVTTVATENGQGISQGVSIIVGHLVIHQKGLHRVEQWWNTQAWRRGRIRRKSFLPLPAPGNEARCSDGGILNRPRIFVLFYSYINMLSEFADLPAQL